MIELVVGLVVGLTLHEWAHAFVAHELGDETPVMYGRVTLNPLEHTTLVGSVLVPAACYLLTGFAFGWGRPVPLDADELGVEGTVQALVAGPAANVILTLAFAVVGLHTAAAVNALLAGFNLFFPAPGLDGWRIVQELRR